MKNLKLIGGLTTLALLGITNVYAKDCTSLQTRINEAEAGTTVNAETCDGTLNIKNNITLDLYGNTINTSNIAVEGNLTLKDSKGNGKIIGTTEGTKAAIVVKGKMTLESGSIEATRHAILADGGSVTINGGSITATWFALGGNNTLGTMVFEVNGGTLKSTEDIAVYMPGPISYTMTNGHVIGGLQFRMGNVNISGGTIEATLGELSDIKTSYKNSGSLNYPDAISIVSGTYLSKHGSNDLNLNITGGTFKTNRQGRAVAIYDYGKVKQNNSINISNGTFETDGNSVYDVLNMNDLGITNPDQGYNNPEFVGKVKTSITGGTFNKDVTSYLSEDYIQNDGVVSKKQQTPTTPAEPDESTNNENLIITFPVLDPTKDVESLTASIANAEEAKNTFINAIKKLNFDITNKEIQVDVTYSNLEEENIIQTVLNSMTDTVKNSHPTAVIAGYFDLTLNVLDNTTNSSLIQLTELDNKVKFNLALPKDMLSSKEGYTRTYYIVRYHDGKSEIINANLNEDKKTISFESDKFSTYALIYKDTKEELTVPKTFDGIASYLAIGAITILSIACLTKYVRKQN